MSDQPKKLIDYSTPLYCIACSFLLLAITFIVFSCIVLYWIDPTRFS